MMRMQLIFLWPIPATASICAMASSLKGKRKKDDITKADNKDSDSCRHYVWKPQQIICQDDTNTLKNYACLVLNREIRIPQPVVIKLWQNAAIRCTVDGGTNRWYNFLESLNGKQCNLKPPDLIMGDFDSITEDTRAHFTNGFSEFIHTPDQNATDFTKAVNIVRPMLLEKGFHDIVVFHDSSGRFDQIMANINTLFKSQNSMLNIYLLSGCSITWLLRLGTHSITIPEDLVKNKRWCSLIPIGEKVINVSTQGLRWNIDNAALHFGGLVSTSNTYNSCVITVRTSGTLVWSMGIFSFVDD